MMPGMMGKAVQTVQIKGNPQVEETFESENEGESEKPHVETGAFIEIKIQTPSIGKTYAGESGWPWTHRRTIMMRTMRAHDDM